MNLDLWIREQLGEVSDIDLTALSSDANLIEHGLHSLQMMRLLERFNCLATQSLLYMHIAKQPCISAWSELLQPHLNTTTSS
ncbi:Phosphopantetheine attachment site [Vibrio xiamenensis]|uniref:Phosphopantetheine attachment site n=1 Tax=Vibrio xiamenensis TaxID=861298 RepID=A0A1G8H7W4_9VIBR|nr:phosphopantetheine-binding protein [Vibrio xiamenensis]SDI02715.1 Phosphopantetheine attachment site [Vibrio xiamenensis]